MRPIHPGFVRVTHWLTALAFLALLVTGVEVILSHPRFYWGEVGNVNLAPLFTLPVPASRESVPTGYAVLPDQNGWSRSLHFLAAWLSIATGLAYVFIGWRKRHFGERLVPASADRSWSAIRASIVGHLTGGAAALGDPASYNVLQRLAYLVVVFVLFPLMIWTGLAMAPAFTAVMPISVELLGERQSARTLHFVITGALCAFVAVHLVMLAVTGFRARVRAMITGTPEASR